MECWTLALSILVGVLAVYYYLFRRGPNVFQQHGIPCAMDFNFLRRLFEIFVFPKSFAKALLDIYNVHPDAKYIGAFNLSRRVVVIRDLELIKSIGIKSFESFEDHLFFGTGDEDPLFSNNLLALRGDRWRDLRALLSPAFTSSKMKTMFHLMSECAVNFAEYLKTTAPPGGHVTEMKDALTRYANDAIGTCAFGIGVDSMRHPENDFYMYGKKVTEFNTFALIKILMIQNLPRLSRFLNIKMMDDRTTEYFVNLVTDTIRTRDERGITRPDMLQLMMDDRGKSSSRELTIMDMTSHVFIFFLAGFDSSSTVMSFATYELGVNPDVQEKLQNEIDEVLEDTNGQPSYEKINGMTYLNAVISEALRMYPPQPMTDRLCTKDFELPATLPNAKPYLVKKGEMVWFPFYALHYNPEYFPEPDKFKPERFLDDNKDQCNLNAYYPFGLGPRMCIGNRFAQLEMKVLLFHLLARCDLKPCEKTPIPLKLKSGGFSMRAEGGCWLNIVPRRNQHSAIASAK
ncbi:hypothetical protein DMN91_012461 [Ooceraea biroi]|uniref:Cytochrome P450 9e2 n=1 Tax=Ooceraea biroi TaxID=2015173 RepID=A0A3L8D4P8_OOCBI|nr:cytochrome P450 9e2-like [Ooceraea biroi]RLU15467.1 hypothetical protein DMN91_012461 [Ooceraea biroi]